MMNHDAPRGWQAAEAAANGQLFVIGGNDRASIARRVAALSGRVATDPPLDPRELARELASEDARPALRLAVVANSRDDLAEKLARAAERLADPRCSRIRDISGIYYTDAPMYRPGGVAFLFPGEGAQYLGMAGDLARCFPEVDAALIDCERLVAKGGGGLMSPRHIALFPADATPAERQAANDELRELGNAIFSVLVADMAMFRVLERFGLRPDLIAGHSAGELAAISAAGRMRDEFDLQARVVQMMRELNEMERNSGDQPATLLAVGAGREAMETLLREVANASGDPNVKNEALVAMDNCPHQTVLVGHERAMSLVERELKSRGLMYERLTLSRPYHTPLFRPYANRLAEIVDALPFQACGGTVYSCTTARPFPPDAAEIRRLTLAHWFAPVEFTRMIRDMYDAGARIFVEVGPRGNLTAFVEDILRGREHLAVASDTARRHGVAQLLHMLGQLAAQGVPLALDNLFNDPSAESAPPALGTSSSNEAEPGPSRGHAAPPAEVATRDAPAVHAVVTGHMELMSRFLDDQQAVMERFLRAGRSTNGLAHRHQPRRATNVERNGQVPADDREPQSRPPLLGTIARHIPNQELVAHRRLDLAEDLYAAEHTVGGRMVSNVDPNHCGLPIAPMTFTLETMAEAATALLPGMVVVEVKNVRLLRWLAFHETGPSEIETTAKLRQSRDAADGQLEVEVTIAIRDTFPLPLGESGGVAASGVVVLANAYSANPAPSSGPLTGKRACQITLDGLYQDLFHGPLFVGVTELTAIGDEGIDARCRVLPRQGLFASDSRPNFLLDPVTLDAAMHPLCAWHLEQNDLSGRTLLPFEMQSLKVFGPCPAEGAEFSLRGRVVESSPRHFVHAVEAFDSDGQLWVAMRVKYWRFYLPFGEVNFHGRKDEYFLSVRLDRAIPPSQSAGTPQEVREIDLNSKARHQRSVAPPRGVCMRLEPPVDLHQPAMQMVAAKMTLSKREMTAYLGLKLPPKERFDWLFERIVAKDAVRSLWWEQHGERFFPADLEIAHDESSLPIALHASNRGERRMPRLSVARAEGLMVAVSSFEPFSAIELGKLDSTAKPAAGELDASEGRLLEQHSDRASALCRMRLAKRALAKALGAPADRVARGAFIRDHATNGDGGETLSLILGDDLAAEFPQVATAPIHVHTERHKNLLLATVFGATPMSATRRSETSAAMLASESPVQMSADTL